MDKVIISDCPICSKPCRAIDKREEAVASEIVKCDGNEHYTCYVSKANEEWRYLARRHTKRTINFPNEKPEINLGYHKKAHKL